MPVTSYAESGYLTIQEAAKYTHLSASTLRRLIAKGDLKDTRIGRIQRIYIGRLDELLATAPSSSELAS